MLSCFTLCDPMDCSPPGSSVHRILQARILEWVAVPSPGGLPNPGIELASLTSPSWTGRWILKHYHCLGSAVSIINSADVSYWDLPQWLSGRICLQCTRCRRWRFNPCVRRTPWNRKWQPTPVLAWMEEHGGVYPVRRGTQSQTQLSMQANFSY